MEAHVFTGHARQRMQQRGIPREVVDWLLDYGRQAHDKHGARLVFFDHRAHALARREIPPGDYARLERHRRTYAVLAADGAVITVGHRRRRIPRH